MKYFFFFFGLVALVVTIIGWRQSFTLKNNGVIADGVITSIVKERNITLSKHSNSHYDIYYPVISFKTENGKTESFKSPNGSKNSSENLVGTHVVVVYDPNNPSLAITQSSNNLKNSVMVGIAFTILFFVIGLILQFRQKKTVLNA